MGSDHSLQREISEWSRGMFGSETPQVMRKMVHEFDELKLDVDSMLAIDAYGGDSSDAANNVAKEAADVLFMLFQLAENVGFDLLEETQKKFDINKSRKWELNDDGTYSHIKSVSP